MWPRTEARGGSCPRPVTSYLNKFEEMGGTILFSTKAEEILMEDGAAAGIPRHLRKRRHRHHQCRCRHRRLRRFRLRFGEMLRTEAGVGRHDHQ